MTIDMTFERQLELAAIEYQKQGIERGEQIKIIGQIIKKIDKNKDLDIIADEIEEDVEIIRPIYDAVIANPGKNSEEIFDIIHK